MRNVFLIFKSIRIDTFSFFKEEKTAAILLVIVIAVYSAVFVSRLGKEEKKPSKAMQQIQLAEEKLEEKQEARELQSFIMEKAGPFEVFLIVFIPVLLILMIVGGVLLDGFLAKGFFQGKEMIHPLITGPPAVSWGVRDLVKTVIYVFFAAIIISLFLGGIQGFLSGNKENFENVFIIFHTVILDVMVLFIIFHQVARKFKDELSSLGLRFSEWWKDIQIGAAGYVAALPIFVFVLLALLFIAEFIGYEPPAHPLVEIFVEEDYKNPALIYLSIFLACTAGPIIEEIFFRGFCYPAFKKKWGVAPAMVLSAGLFALIHQSLFAFLPIFVLGLAFAFVYEKRKSLLPSIVMHIIHNTIFIGYFFILKRAVLDRLVQS